MKLLDPYAVNDSTLVSSDVPETLPAWAAGTYALGDLVQDPTTHTVFESLANSNTAALTDASKWLDSGPTNRWGMFDQKLGTLTVQAEAIEVNISVDGRVTGLAFFRLEAAEIQVTVTDSIEGEVYDETFDLVSYDNVNDFWDYFFAPIIRRRDFFIEGLPLYSGANIRVRILNPGGTVQIGNLVPGVVIEFGETVLGASVGIIDYSKKEADQDFGTVDLVERDYRTPATFRDVVDPYLSDELERVLTERRAKPTVFVIERQPTPRLIYGFARDWESVADEGGDIISGSLESLT